MNVLRTLSASLVLVASVAAADDAAAAKLWTEKVQPLLEQRCYGCHGPTKAKHDLRLDSPEAILKGGREMGPTVIAGKPDDSPLVKVCLLPRDEEEAMPPKSKGDGLNAEQIGWLKAWITGGAPMPAPAKK
jgi:mono/diheme cytochrome c family protein